ncbi:hypothetical protein HZA33_00575 [Candidatus Pacearchaeota archaeon]|nr:hypothetical protein [Candidatus Pacearchaeota archaeon]
MTIARGYDGMPLRYKDGSVVLDTDLSIGKVDDVNAEFVLDFNSVRNYYDMRKREEDKKK